MGKNYYSEGYQPQSAEGKCAWHEVQGRLGIGFQGFLSCAVTQDKFHSVSTSCDTTREMLPTGGVRRESACPEFLLGTDQPVPVRYPNCRLPEGV